MTNEQRSLLKQALTDLESAVMKFDAMIAAFDSKRAEFVVQRNAALFLIAEKRAALGIATTVQ